jgi:hypothetical protein
VSSIAPPVPPPPPPPPRRRRQRARMVFKSQHNVPFCCQISTTNRHNMSSSTAFNVLDVFDDSDESSILSIDDVVAITGRQAAEHPCELGGIPVRAAQSSGKKNHKKPPKPKAAAPPAAAAAAAGAGKARPRPPGRPRKIQPIAGPCSLQLRAATMQFHQTHTRSLVWYQLQGYRPPALPPRFASGCRVFGCSLFLFPPLYFCNSLPGTT